MPYAIYPTIGFARLGNSSDYFIGREFAGMVHTDDVPACIASFAISATS